HIRSGPPLTLAKATLRCGRPVTHAGGAQRCWVLLAIERTIFWHTERLSVGRRALAVSIENSQSTAHTASVGSGRRAFVNFPSFRLPKYHQNSRPSLLSLLLTVSTKPVDKPVENLRCLGSISR